MSFGKPYILDICGCIHDGWLVIRNQQKIFDIEYLCNTLDSFQLHKQYLSLAAGSAFHNLNKELVGSVIISYPNLKEQILIGSVFALCDKIITLHQRK